MRTSHRSVTTMLAIVMSLGLLLFVAVGTVSAHAKVIDANPKIGSTITTPPTTIIVKTAENMKPGPQLSNLFVYGPAGDVISQGDAKIALNDPMHMSVTIKPSGNGISIVRWITVSADDGDPDQGAFLFTVGASSSTSSSPSSAATASAKPATNASPATTGTGSMPLWVPIIVGLVALVIGLGAGFGVGRTRTASPPLAPSPGEENVPTKQS